MKKILLTTLTCLCSMVMMAQTYNYVITAESGNFIAKRNNGAVTVATNSGIQSVIDAIKADANGNACEITFGNGTPLNICTSAITFDGSGSPTWGLITLKGHLQGAVAEPQGLINLLGDASVNLNGTTIMAKNLSLTDAELTDLNCATSNNVGILGDITYMGLSGARFTVDELAVGNGAGSQGVWVVQGTGANSGIRQEWTGAVQVSNCTGTPSWATVSPNTAPYQTACRSATNGFEGHYFSWCFVKRYETQLCPNGWRVPTNTDFVNLHLALGGTGTTAQSINPSDLGYCPATGGSADAHGAGSGHNSLWGGSRYTASASSPTTASNSVYWSASQVSESTTNAFSLWFSGATVMVLNNYLKNSGYALRCVREN
jgi:uncharacterized protein (TIGR02145 family)